MRHMYDTYFVGIVKTFETVVNDITNIRFDSMIVSILSN